MNISEQEWKSSEWVIFFWTFWGRRKSKPKGEIMQTIAENTQMKNLRFSYVPTITRSGLV